MIAPVTQNRIGFGHPSKRALGTSVRCQISRAGWLAELRRLNPDVRDTINLGD